MNEAEQAWRELQRRAAESKFGGIRADSDDLLDDPELREALINPNASGGKDGDGQGGTPPPMMMAGVGGSGAGPAAPGGAAAGGGVAGGALGGAAIGAGPAAAGAMGAVRAPLAGGPGGGAASTSSRWARWRSSRPSCALPGVRRCSMC